MAAESDQQPAEGHFDEDEPERKYTVVVDEVTGGFKGLPEEL